MNTRIETEKAARRKRTAEEILDAMEASGLSRKEFAMKMGWQPSEVTKWLSGKHNFTIALLEEISDALGTDITGVEDIRILIEGFDAQGDSNMLMDSGPVYGRRTNLYYTIRRRSAELGVSAYQYIEQLVEKDIEKDGELPKVELPLLHCEAVEKYSGIMNIQPSAGDLDSDERLSRIWKR